MREYMEKLLAVLLLVVAYGNTEVTVENGGYSVLVSFSQNVPSKDGKVLLNNMEDILKDTSEILHSAIGLHFSKVTFKMPTSWDTSEWNITTEQSFSSSKTDFLIDNTNDVVFGKFPFAQQYGSCGTPGKQITIPTSFFDEANTFPRGISLTREWLKYRYGVFDENGFFGDPLYPLYYITPGRDPDEVQITECTNSEVTYKFLDQNGNNCSEFDKPIIQRLNSRECIIKPDENLENITSSIMYFQEDIHILQHICGKDPDHNHNSRSPNKHNALCHGQSVWDIVKKSPDFQKETNAEGYSDIEYVYVQETKPKIVVAWENTEQLKNKGPVILNAINKFMIDLPSGSKFNGFPFKASIPTPETRDYTLHDLNGLDDKKRITQDISSDFVKAENGDINLAILKAMDIFSSASADSNSEVQGTIIVITKSTGSIDETLLQRLKDSKVCIILMFFSEGAIPEEIQNYASALPCGSLEQFSMTDKDEDVFEKLFEAMETILPSIADNKATETVKTEYLSKESSISVKVDNLVETVTFWIFSKKESENFELKFNGEEKGTNVIKAEIIGSILALSYSPTQAGNIQLSFPHDTEKMLTQVRITSKEGKYFMGDVFIHDTSEEESSVQMPVIIYAFIRFGAYPVQNAIVSATIERPNEKNIELELNDDGKGDPDITRNDGIYSRYFTSFSERGEYTVTVTVRNNAHLTTFGADEHAGYQTCCGSYVKGDPSKLAEFSKVFKTTFNAKSGRPNDGYKPSRILDLRIQNFTDDKIILTWTAPGEETDYGTASRYEIKLFCGEENVTDCDIHKMVRVLNKPPPMNYGREQQVTIQIIENTQILSVGIVTVNEKNKFSDLSNVVEIFRPTDKLEVITTKPDTSIKQASSEGIIIGAVIASILIITCIAVGIIYYFKRKSQDRKPDIYEIEGNINKDNHQEVKSTFKATDYSIKNAPVKKIESFPVLLYTHNQIKDFKNKDKDPPLYKANIPPKLWASLDVISSIQTGEDNRDTKSLGSSSTIDATTDGSEVNILTDVESQIK